MPAPALLFDIGNVLVHFDFVPAAKRFAAQSEATEAEVLDRLRPFKDDLESGQISDEDFIRESMGLIGFQGTKEDFITTWGDIFTENAPMIELVSRLQGTVPLYLLSNTSGLHKDWLFAKFPVFQHFAGGIYSHEAGCMKPRDEIFHLASTTFDLDPAKTFYIDDLIDNIATGNRLGFVSHHYHHDRHSGLESELRRWLAQ
ncbi:MAG TPA: HAD family phosphatase [Verrucomicrobium sp.]|nr:HAD family phosphatase [Verrucomicrobium sp.]